MPVTQNPAARSVTARPEWFVSAAAGLLLFPVPEAWARSPDRLSPELAWAVCLGVFFVLVLGWLLTFLAWRRTFRQLRGAEAATSEMISRITHDAKHYLTVIKGKVDVFLMKQEQGREFGLSAMRSDLKLMQENALSLDRLIENLNDREHLNKGAVTVCLRDFDLAALTGKVVHSFGESLPKRDIHLQFLPGPDEVWVHADSVLVEQALMNLVHNAVKFSRVGGLVEVWIRREGRDVRTRVRDQGTGMAPDSWERVFEPFVRLRPEIRGSGLGLSNARGFIRLMGGELGVEDSRVGEGATFYFTLPAAAPEGAAPAGYAA